MVQLLVLIEVRRQNDLGLVGELRRRAKYRLVEVGLDLFDAHRLAKAHASLHWRHVGCAQLEKKNPHFIAINSHIFSSMLKSGGRLS